MTTSTELALGLQYGAALGEQNWNVWMDSNLVQLGACAQISVKNMTITSPPTVYVEGDRYIIGPSATGEFLGKDGKLAYAVGGAYQYYTVKVGWTINDESTDTLKKWNGTTYVNEISTAMSAHTAASDPHTGYALESSIGLANGIAGLDGTGKVPAAQLPSYVDDVLEFANLAALPATGETGKIYVALDTSKTYRWSGSVYVAVGADGDLSLTYADVFADVVLSGLVFPTSADLTSTMTSGVAEVIGTRVVVPATANTFIASKDTYVDLSNTGVITYLPVALNAAAPAVTVNSLRLQKVVTSATDITSVVQLASRELTANRNISVPAPTLGGHAATKTFVEEAVNSGGNWVEFVADSAATTYWYNAAALSGKKFLRTEDATLNGFRISGTPADGFELIVRVDTSVGPSIRFTTSNSTATIDGSSGYPNGKEFAIPNSMLSLVYDASSNDWNTSFIGGKAGWRINNGQATDHLNLDRATFGDSGSYVTGSTYKQLSVSSTSDVAIGSDYIIQGVSWINFANEITVLTPRGEIHNGDRYLKFGNNVGVVRIIRKSSTVFYVEGNFDYDFEIKSIDVFSSGSPGLSLGTAGGAVDRVFLTLTGNAGYVNLAAHNKGNEYRNFEQIFTIYAMQDATGGRTLDFPASVKWLGEKGTLSVAPNALDIITLRTKDAGTTWYATIQKSEEAANSKLKFANVFADFVVSGLLTPVVANLTSSLTAGSAYVGGTLIARGNVSKAYTASKDTYVDIDTSGTLTYVEVANAAAAPAVTANSLRLQKVVTDATAITSIENLANRQPTFKTPVTVPDAVVAGDAANKGQLDAVAVQSITIVCSDETTALTAGAAKVTLRMPYAFTLQAVRASLTTAQTSGALFTVDINESGVSVLSQLITIDNTEKTSTTALTPAVITDTALADDAEITIDIDQIGDGTATGLKVYLIGVKA